MDGLTIYYMQILMLDWQPNKGHHCDFCKQGPFHPDCFSVRNSKKLKWVARMFEHKPNLKFGGDAKRDSNGSEFWGISICSFCRYVTHKWTTDMAADQTGEACR